MATSIASIEMGIPAPVETPIEAPVDQDALYERVNAEFGQVLARLARSYEANPAQQQDLLQEVHIALWRSLPAFAGRCSLRTWVYRVAHNAAATYVQRRLRRTRDLVDLEDIEIPSDSPDVDVAVDDARMLSRLHALVQRLKPLDRQVFVLYLEGLSMEDIAEIAGLTETNTRTKLHRIRALLSSQLRTGDAP
jgi:RNA polymerase sigma-70 factor (ECF subfamily)